MPTTSTRSGAESAARLGVDWRVAVACAAALIAVSSVQNPSVLGAPPRPLSVILLAQTVTWGLWLALLPLIVAIARRGHARGLRKWSTIAEQLIASLGVALLHSLLLAVVRWSIGLPGPRDLRVLLPNLVTFVFAGAFLRYWLIAIALHATAFHRESQERALNEGRLAARLAEARLETLEGRMQPHFLFNTLNSIAALVRKNPPAAAVMVENLSELLRAALDVKSGREITLDAELELLQRYTDIQQVRFADRLRVIIDVHPDARAAYVPQMLLQPLVENAIRHGLAPREIGGTVTIHGWRSERTLSLSVCDDGVGLRDGGPAHGRGIGIDGTRARLQHLYGDAFSFTIASSTPGGTIVRIELPFHGSPLDEKRTGVASEPVVAGAVAAPTAAD